VFIGRLLRTNDNLPARGEVWLMNCDFPYWIITGGGQRLPASLDIEYGRIFASVSQQVVKSTSGFGGHDQNAK